MHVRWPRMSEPDDKIKGPRLLIRLGTDKTPKYHIFNIFPPCLEPERPAFVDITFIPPYSRRPIDMPDDERLQKRRQYYLQNQGAERKKARERARRRSKTLTPEEKTLLAERHRQVQARYRERNRQQLAIRSWEYRCEVVLLHV